MHRLDAQGSRTFSYTSFGSRAPGADDAPGLGFNGQYRERDSAYLLGHGYRSYRSYRPALRRFNSPDNFSPFAQGGLNAYAYCRGEPINRRDPSGHIPEDLIPGLVVGAGLLARLIGFRGLVRKFGTEKMSRFSTALVGGGAVAVLFGGLALAAKGDIKSPFAGVGVAALLVGAGIAMGGKGVPLFNKSIKPKTVANTSVPKHVTDASTSPMTPTVSPRASVSSPPAQASGRQVVSAPVHPVRRLSESSITSEGSYVLLQSHRPLNGDRQVSVLVKRVTGIRRQHSV